MSQEGFGDILELETFADNETFSLSSRSSGSGSDDDDEEEEEEPEYAREGTLRGHSHSVSMVCLFPEGTTAVTASRDKTLKLWDLASHECTATLEGHTDYVLALCVTSNGQAILSAGGDGTVRVWDTESRLCTATVEAAEGAIHALTLLWEDRWFATGGSDNTVRLWDLSTPRCQATLARHTGAVTSLCYIADSGRLASSSEDRTIIVWDLISGTNKHKQAATLKDHKGAVNVVCATQDGDNLISASTDTTIRVWDLSDYSCLAILEGHASAVNALSRNGERLASGCADGSFKVWDLNLHECMGTYRDDARLHINDVSFTPGGQHVLTATRVNMTRIWRVAAVNPITTLPEHARAIAVHPDQKHLLVGSQHGAITMWNMASAERVSLFEAHKGPVLCMCVAPTATAPPLLISGGKSGELKLWDLATHACIRTLQRPKPTGPALSVCATPDLSYLIAAHDTGVACVWRRDTGALACVLTGHNSVHPVNAVCCTSDSRFLITGSGDTTAKVWRLAALPDDGSDTTEDPCVAVLKGHRGGVMSLCSTPNGCFVISGGEERAIRIWAVGAWECVVTLTGHRRDITALSVTADSQFLLAADMGGVIRVWCLQSHLCKATLEEHKAEVGDVAVTRDKSLVASCSKDGTLKLWPVPLVLGGPCHSPGPKVYPPFALLDAVRNEDTAVLKRVLQQYPATLFAPAILNGEEMTLLAWAATRSDYSRALEAMLATPGLLLMDLTPEPSVLLKAVEDSRDTAVIRQVAGKICHAARNRDLALERPRRADGWQLDTSTLRLHLTEDVLMMIKEFPALAGEFLADLGLVRVCTDEGYDHDLTQLPPSRMIVAGSPYVHLNRRFWSDLSDSGELEALEDGSAPLTLTEARVVPLKLAAAFLPNGTSLLEHLVSKGEATLFGNLIARAVVQFKWQAFGQRKFLREAAWFSLSVLLITTLTFVFNPNGRDITHLLGTNNANNVGGSGGDLTSVVLLLALAVMAAIDLVREAGQSRYIKGYWRDFWNWLDLTNVLLVFAVLGTYFGGWVHARAFLAIAVYLRWYGLLYYLQPFQSTGPLVRMILVICFDMRYFLLVLAISIVAAWTSFRLLLLDDNSLPLEELGDPANGLLIMFNMLLLADFELDIFGGEYVVLLRILFVLSMVLVPVVLLNLLIALMSDSYERIQDRADIEFQLLRARILREQEAFMTEDEKADPDVFPTWLHVLVPKGEAAGRDAGGVQWQGMLHELKKELWERARNNAKHTHNVAQQLDTRMTALESTVQEEQRVIKDRILGVEKQLASLVAALQAAPRGPRTHGADTEGEGMSTASTVQNGSPAQQDV